MKSCNFSAQGSGGPPWTHPLFFAIKSKMGRAVERPCKQKLVGGLEHIFFRGVETTNQMTLKKHDIHDIRTKRSEDIFQAELKSQSLAFRSWFGGPFKKAYR